ncbi:MAG: hypothetical protein HWE27_14015 [Gammaproteobacteria bacterium]|nr:hypothetical protein [Gammaproteobacteria bacterium]
MSNGTPAEDYIDLFKYIELAYKTGNEELKKCIGVTFIENLFWQVDPEKASPYWKITPEALKKLYLDFFGLPPLKYEKQKS